MLYAPLHRLESRTFQKILGFQSNTLNFLLSISPLPPAKKIVFQPATKGVLQVAMMRPASVPHMYYLSAYMLLTPNKTNKQTNIAVLSINHFHTALLTVFSTCGGGGGGPNRAARTRHARIPRAAARMGTARTFFLLEKTKRKAPRFCGGPAAAAAAGI